VAQPEPSRTVKVAVLLTIDPHNVGGWLADGAAFDAAGADVLWIDHGPDPELDPLALMAALAVVTSRSNLVTISPPSDGPAAAHARSLTTVDRLSHGRLSFHADGPAETHRWFAAPPPDSRAAWRLMLAEAAEGGFEGVLVPANPRLLDILRNPEEPGERRDLFLAQG
jgi:Luciferase-like monooxygenase